jgi:hypothetical protein
VDFSTIEIPARQATKLTRRRFLLELVHHRIREEGYRRDVYIGEIESAKASEVAAVEWW